MLLGGSIIKSAFFKLVVGYGPIMGQTRTRTRPPRCARAHTHARARTHTGVNDDPTEISACQWHHVDSLW